MAYEPLPRLLQQAIDQFSQGAAGQPDASQHPLSPVVDVAGGDPVNPAWPGLSGGDGALLLNEKA